MLLALFSVTLPSLAFDCVAGYCPDSASDPRRVHVPGESFQEVPPEFEEGKAWLVAAGKVYHWGYAASRRHYFDLLRSCDVAVSTADHEFFGCAMVEAVRPGYVGLCSLVGRMLCGSRVDVGVCRVYVPGVVSLLVVTCGCTAFCNRRCVAATSCAPTGWHTPRYSQPSTCTTRRGS